MKNMKAYYFIMAFLLIIFAYLIKQLDFLNLPFEIQLSIIPSLILNYDSNSSKNSNTKDQSFENLQPIKFYNNAAALKNQIIADNKKKSGLYMWENKTNGKKYIGSAIDLSRRFSHYFSKEYLSYPKHKMLIYKALLKYGYSNFTLSILEYCSIEDLISREQFYLDSLIPQYNLLQTAGSTTGYKHSTKALKKIRESKIGNTNRLGLKHSAETKLKIGKSLGTKLEVFDTFTQSKIVYDSILSASKAIGCEDSTIIRNLQKFAATGLKKPIKKRYLISKFNK